MAKSNRPTHISKPVYPGGNKAMNKFVREQLQYPAAALKQKVEGTVTIRYSLDYRGKVVATRVKSGIGHGCDEEAVRVVKLLKFTVPQSSKKKVRIHQDINIHFKLPKVKKKKVATQPPPSAQGQSMMITYTTTKSVEGKPEEKPKDDGGGYGYTISW